MSATLRPRRDFADDGDQLRVLVASPEQAACELLQSIVRFGQPIPERAAWSTRVSTFVAETAQPVEKRGGWR